MNHVKDEIIRILSTKIRFAPYSEFTDNIQAFCPFHKGGQEKKPAFYVYVGPTRSARQATGASFCHTCGKGWSFSSLLRKLGIGRAYVDVVNEIYDEETRRKPKDFYGRINLDVPKLPEEILGAFEWAPKKLLEEGFDKAILRDFDIGFDRSRKRITFPIRDHHGNLVGLSGRNLDGVYPRYKIYRKELHSIAPGYELKKSRVVWGLDRFYLTAMTVGVYSPIVICEGFKAAMWTAQHGFDNVVCLLGTYCSEEQRMLLSRVTNEVVVFLDNDEPGKDATGRLVPYLREWLDVRVANYPKWADGMSPDDLCADDLKPAIVNTISEEKWRDKWARTNKRKRSSATMNS
jgi:hypothetical protein